MQNGKRAMLPKTVGQQLSSSRAGISCLRTVRWAMPMLLAAVLSSYATYLFLYHGRLSQHAPRNTAAAAAWDNTGSSRQHAFGDGGIGAFDTPSSSQATVVGSHRYAPQDAAFQWVQAAGRRMRVAVVNEAPYHLEVVAGLLQALNDMPVDVTWYQAGQTTVDGTLSPTELVEVTGFTQLLGYLPLMKPNSSLAEPCDYAILVSPEYFLQATKVRATRSQLQMHAGRMDWSDGMGWV